MLAANVISPITFAEYATVNGVTTGLGGWNTGVNPSDVETHVANPSVLINRSNADWGQDWTVGSPHPPGGMQVVMGDASVTWIEETIADSILALLRDARDRQVFTWP